MVAGFLLVASLALAQEPAQRAVDDAFEAQRRQRQAQWLTGQKQLRASYYFLSERLYWTALKAVEKLPATQRLVAALARARRALAGPWSPSAPTEAAQALAAAEKLARDAGASWIESSVAEVRKGLPDSERDWSAVAAQSKCYSLQGPASIVYAPGSLSAIGLARFTQNGETLTLSDLSMDGTTLHARAELRREGEMLSSEPAAFPLGRTVRIGKVALTEKTAGSDVCHLTWASAEALFDLPAD
jgi:hypothetical protein